MNESKELRGWHKAYVARGFAYYRYFFRKQLVVARDRSWISRGLPGGPWQHRVVDPATDAVLAFADGYATPEAAASAAMVATRLLT